MTDYSDKTVMVVDSGLFCSFAECLTRFFGRVLYHSHWVSQFPKPNLALINTGIEGVERVDYFWNAVLDEDIDLFVFLDVHTGDWQRMLRSMGKRVWGPGMGEEIELFRADAKRMQAKVGLPVGPWKLITGIKALREYLKDKEDKYIKVSKFRGRGESWHWVNMMLSEPKLDEIEGEEGPFADDAEWIVEDSIPTFAEVGYDGYTINGKFPQKNALCGIECKDLGYIGGVMPYSDLPEGVREVNSKLSQVFSAYDYRSFYSSEIRIGEDKKPHLIDSTCRCPSPVSEIYQELFKNLGEILWEGAAGNCVDFEPTAKYAFELLLYSEWARDHWEAIHIPPEAKQWTKLFNQCQRRKTRWIIPSESKLIQVGAVIGLGNTIEEAIKTALKHADMVKGTELEVKKDTIPKLLRTLQESKKNGMTLGDSPIPSSIE